VVLENFKVDALARYGLDYENLKALNPGLVYCSITGFGQDGPYSGYAGYHFMIQGMGGLMSITGEPDEAPGGGPLKVGVAVADLFAGMYAAVAVLAALAHRERTGEGQYIDLALLDCQVAMLANQAMNYLVSGTPPRRLGNAHLNIVPYQTLPTRDGHLILAIGNDRQFGRFCELTGRPALAADPRFATNAAQVAHREALIPMIAETMATHSTGEWLALLEPASIPCGPINTLDQVFRYPQVVHRGMTVSLPHPCSGIVPQVASPLRPSRTPVEYRRAPPALGQDTEEVLKSLLAINAEEVAALRQRGIV
jgi:crotonobetainyl-CoA:carnitine CoA-transferase CaiB-like acyl-CoA transferase